MSTPFLGATENIIALPERDSPYWNILEFCRHIGIEKRSSREIHWLARVRNHRGGYKQRRLSKVSSYHVDGVSYEVAVLEAHEWFGQPEVQAIAAEPYPKGENATLNYTSQGSRFTIGDALADYVEWKRIAATKSTFHSLLSLINCHIVPRLGDVALDDLNGAIVTEFCRDILETPAKRGNRRRCKDTLQRVQLSDLEADALRRRKGTLNTLLGILRLAIQMAWENGNTDSERAWRCIRRVPNLEVPRRIFLTRQQCRSLLEHCRPDLADLVRAALYTGCRVSELSALRVSDIGDNFFGVYVAPAKSRRGRHVVLPTEGMRFFLSQIEGKGEQDLVFRTQKGNCWRGHHKHLFKSAVREAGIPEGFVFHGLRHTYASQLVQAGTPLAIVARQLGHSNTDTVSRTYGHLSCTSIEKEIEIRFATIDAHISGYNEKMATIRESLQHDGPKPISSSWPRSNFNRSGGELVALLKER